VLPKGGGRARNPVSKVFFVLLGGESPKSAATEALFFAAGCKCAKTCAYSAKKNAEQAKNHWSKEKIIGVRRKINGSKEKIIGVRRKIIGARKRS